MTRAKVRVTKTEKPTQRGAWTGAAVGALVGIIFPPAVIGSAIVGAGAGELGPPGKRPAVANTQPGIPLALRALTFRRAA